MQKVEKAYEITDVKIQFVSLVDAAANKRQFLLKKSDDGKAAFTTFGRIIKADEEKHYVTGIVYEPMTEDSQGNFMTEKEIIKAAYYFAKNGNKVDLQHNFEPLDGATVVENWIAKADFEIDGEKVAKGTWLMTVEVTDETVWTGIEKGEITGFSMGGLGNYSEEDVELDNVEKQEKKGLLKQLAAALGLKVVEKGAMAELYEERNQGTLFWNAFNSLEDILYQYDPITGRWQYETNEDKVRECLEDFNQIITSILTGKENITKAIQSERPVEKAGKKMSGKNKETLSGIYESLGTFLKEFDDPAEEGEEEEKEVTKQEVEAIVAKSIEAAIAKATQDAKTEEKEKTDEEKSKEVKKSNETITPESITTMVEAAIAKAMEPKQETVTAAQVQDIVTAAVTKAIEPVLKARGLPTNLGGNSSTVEKSEEHYLHGIL